MHTLFSSNILSPPLIPATQPNPFDALFSATVSTNSTASATSSSARSLSPTQYNLLTQRLQEEQQNLEDSRYVEPTSVRRKGHPKLLLMGQRRSGKSSIQNVILQKMPPTETLYLESTNSVKTVSMQSFAELEMTEVPSQLSIESPEIAYSDANFRELGTVIWVIDVQDDYLSSIDSLVHTAGFLAENYPRVHFEVFIHKTDGLSEEYRYDAFREVRQRVQDELSDVGFGHREVAFHQTSIFDHSIYEAVSKVVQRLLPQLPALEALLNRLCSTCGMRKAYLFDTVSKIYVATDASPTFLKDYEVCSDYVDVIVDIKALYGWQDQPKAGANARLRTNDGPDAEDDGIGESIVTFERNGDTYIYAREITEHLSLICLMGKGSGVDKRVLIDYNVSLLQDAVVEVFKV
ncbi:hypothetical protein Q7P37_010821 [Cladosporium fusiforme]